MWGIASKPTFRQRRARVLADGFYEWQKLERGRKQPVLIRRRDHSGRPA
jgi:putative SOS response-associated peptidase YedK